METRTCPRCSSWFATEQVDGEFSGICPNCLAAFMTSDPGVETPLRISSAGSPPAMQGLQETPLRPGSRFGGFEILDVLGQGGMGIVYKARQTSLDRTVALKVLAPRIAGSEEFARRFNHEAKVLASLNHPNVVQVHDFGREGGIHYLVMEHVDGESLESALKRKRPDPAWLLRVLRDVARGLRRVHEAGLVHRDLKPANILITRDGTAKIGDFGLAVETLTPQRLTEQGYFVGTPHYVSPEHAKGENVDGRSDLYALGVILFEGFAGRPPFLAASPTAVLVKHMEEPAPPLEKFAPQAPASVAAVVRRLLEKDPARRYASASELEAALSAASIRRVSPSRRSRPLAFASAAAFLLALLTYLLWPHPAPVKPALPFLLAAADALKADQYDDAARAAEEARRRSAADPTWSAQAQGLSDRIAAIRSDRLALRAGATGDDEEFGQFLCFSKGDWERGLPMIAAGEESPYRAIAKKDLARPIDAAGRIEIAEGWLDAALRVKKARWAERMKERAWAWLSAARPEATPPQREAIDRRLAQLDSKLEARREIDLLSLANPAKFSVAGEFQLEGGRLRTPPTTAFARISLPYLPPDEYDLEIAVERRTGEGALYVGLPHPLGSIGLEIDAAGRSRIDGTDVRHAGRFLPEGKTVRLSISLRPERLELRVDDTTILESRVGGSVAESWRVPENRLLFLGSNASAFLISKASLRGVLSLPRAPAPQPPAPEISGIDLLGRMDIQRDAVAGTWKKTDRGVASSRGDKFGHLQLPGEVPASYDLLLTVQRKEGSGAMNLGLAVGGASCCVVLDGWTGDVSGLALVDNHGADDNETTSRGRPVLRRNKVVNLVCSVRPSQVKVTVDGSPLFDWKGDPGKLRLHPDFVLPNARGLFLGSSTSSFEVSRLILIPVPEQVNLLALVDPARDTVAGQWARSGTGLLTLTTTPFPRVLVPYVLPEEYDVTVEAERKEGIRALVLGAVSGASQFTVLLDGWTGTISGLDLLDNKGADKNEATVSGTSFLPLDRKVTIDLSIRKSGVLVRIDGRTVIDWKGDSSRLSLHKNMEVPRKGFFIGTWDSRFLIHRAALEPAGASGRPVSKVTPGVPVDLLALVRPARDIIKGEWKLEGGILVSPAESEARIQLPYELPEEYDLLVTAERRSSDQRSFHIGLPIAGRGVLVTLDGFGVDRCALENLNGKPSEGAGLSYQRQVFKEVGVPVTVTCKVRRKELTISAGGDAVLAWSGDPKRLDLPQPWRGINPKMALLGVFRSEFHVRKVELIPQSAAVSPDFPGEMKTGVRNGFVDLLGRVDPKLDTVSGKWVREGGTLVSDDAERAKLEIPYEPPAEYDYRVVFSRVRGISDVNQILSRNGTAFAWCMGGMGNSWSGFGSIRDVWAPERGNASRVRLGVEADRTYESVVEVRSSGLKAYLDGVLVCEWKTNYSDMDLQGAWRVRNDRLLGLGTFNSPTRFHRVEIREVTGRGRSTRGEVDLLALVDPAADAVHGTFVRSDTLLITPEKEIWSRIRIPYAPPEEYDLELSATRRSGGDNLALGILKGGRQAMAIVGGQSGKAGGIEMIDGLNFMLNPTRFEHPFLENGKPFTLTVSVRKTGIEMSLDGKPVARWDGDPKRLSLHHEWRMPDEQSLFLCSQGSSFEVRSLKLIPKSGEGRRTR